MNQLRTVVQLRLRSQLRSRKISLMVQLNKIDQVVATFQWDRAQYLRMEYMFWEAQVASLAAMSWDLSIGIRAMASNKDRIENLEAALGQLQDGIAEMKIGFADKFQHLEDIVTKLSDTVLSGKGGDNYKQAGRLMFYSKLTKLEFPTYRGEANQWWRWLHKTYQEEGKEVMWEIFYEELWSRFGPTDCEDFDEALSKVQQTGPFREYQKEFERLGNRVRGWTQKALVGTFMGGLKHEIADGIRMFKPTNLKDATSLARMRDEQLNRLSPITQASSCGPTKNTTMKRLTWDEMQKKRAQGLCFNCDEKISMGHKCKGP
ncbi:retrovirus-related pol polyprotein from transposon 17.6 [Tanacetum coccineum]